MATGTCGTYGSVGGGRSYQQGGEGEVVYICFHVCRRTAESHVTKMLEFARAVITDASRYLERAYVYHRVNIMTVC